MLVSAIKLLTRDTYCELQAKVKFETHWVWGDDPFTLWYRFPLELEEYLDPENGDAFLAAFLPPAMVLGEPLKIDAPVSSKLLDSAEKIQSLLRTWYPSLSQTQIAAPAGSNQDSQTSGTSRGLFFSLGSDSFYTLLKNLRDHSHDEETITHLVTVEGFDVYLWESDRYPAVVSNFERVAKEFGKSALRVTTNLREFSDRVADWVKLYDGAAMASVGLLLQRLFSTMHISSGRTYADLMPLGTHPLLDPLWSTERISFQHDGCEASRLEKIIFLGQEQAALDTLRVCAISEESDVYNCGQCPKCLITMVALHIAGTLKDCKTLPSQINLDLVRSMPTTDREDYITQLIDALGTSREDFAIKTALKQCLLQDKSVVGAAG